MNDELHTFIEKAKAKNLTDQEIEQKLLVGGWPPNVIRATLYGGEDNLAVPKPPTVPVPTIQHQYDANNPIPVVQNLSTRGFEYSIMFFSLWASALGIAVLLNSVVGNYIGDSGDYGFSSGSNAFFVTVVVVFAPVFAFMFLRLKKAEISNPSLLRDPSRRKLSHLTQFITFITGATYLIYFVYSLMNGNVGKEGQMSLSELIGHLIITIAVAGSIFYYYWREEHSSGSRPDQPNYAPL